MIEKIQVELNRCTCWCGHRWLSEDVPKRCAGKGKHRDWNARDPKPSIQTVKVPESEPESDPFADVSQIEKPAQEKPKSSGSKIAEDLLAQMALKLGRPSHALNCTCYICKPPKEVK